MRRLANSGDLSPNEIKKRCADADRALMSMRYKGLSGMMNIRKLKLARNQQRLEQVDSGELELLEVERRKLEDLIQAETQMIDEMDVVLCAMSTELPKIDAKTWIVAGQIRVPQTVELAAVEVFLGTEDGTPLAEAKPVKLGKDRQFQIKFKSKTGAAGIKAERKKEEKAQPQDDIYLHVRDTRTGEIIHTEPGSLAPRLGSHSYRVLRLKEMPEAEKKESRSLFKKKATKAKTAKTKVKKPKRKE